MLLLPLLSSLFLLLLLLLKSPLLLLMLPRVDIYMLEQLYKRMYFLLICLVVKITVSGWGGKGNFFMDLLADVRNKPY